jgi:hypothetical protein
MDREQLDQLVVLAACAAIVGTDESREERDAFEEKLLVEIQEAQILIRQYEGLLWRIAAEYPDAMMCGGFPHPNTRPCNCGSGESCMECRAGSHYCG